MRRAKMTEAQQTRQHKEYRDRGKYTKVNPCYVCGKSAGVNYYSSMFTDCGTADLGLVLCKRCCSEADALGEAGKIEEHVAMLLGGQRWSSYSSERRAEMLAEYVSRTRSV